MSNIATDVQLTHGVGGICEVSGTGAARWVSQVGGTEAVLGWLHQFPHCLPAPGVLQGARRARWAGHTWAVPCTCAMGHGSCLSELFSFVCCHPAPAVAVLVWDGGRCWGAGLSTHRAVQRECACFSGGANEGVLGREGCLLGSTHVQRVGVGRGVYVEQRPARPKWVHQSCLCSALGVPGPQKGFFSGCPPYTSSWPSWQWSFIAAPESCCGEILGGAPTPSITY